MERVRLLVVTRLPQRGNRLPLLRRTHASFPGTETAERRLLCAWDQHAVRSPNAHSAPHEQQASVNLRPLLPQHSMREQQKLLESCSVLATCAIRSPNRTLKNIFTYIPSLRMSQSECRSESIHLLIFIKGDSTTFFGRTIASLG